MALTCQKVLNSSNQRFTVSWGDKISFSLEEKNLCQAAVNFLHNSIPRDSFQIPDVNTVPCVCAVTTHTPMRTRASALASSVWGRWRFISSPSKSALYGVQTHSLNRNVLWGLTLAWLVGKELKAVMHKQATDTSVFKLAGIKPLHFWNVLFKLYILN